MRDAPPQQATGTISTDAEEELVHKLSEDLERAISFAEECRWRFPELSADAERLTAGAMALFGKTVRSLREASRQS